MSGQSSDDIQKQADEIVRQIRDIIPPEMLGFLIAALIVVGFIGVVWFFGQLRSPVKAVKGKVSAKRGRSKAREAALAAGFIVDDVERDVPEFGRGMAYVLKQESCAHYHWPENVHSTADWELLCRPGDFTPGLDQRGWLLQTNQGRISQDTLSVLNSITRSMGEPRDFFEIEILNSQLHFYWREHGGDEAVDMLTTFVEMLKRAS